MNWQLLLLISVLATSIKGILFRSLMKQAKSDPRTQTIVFLTISGTLALLVALSKGFQFPDFPRLLPNFGLMVFLLTLAPVLNFRAFKLTGAAETAIFSRSEVLMVVLGSFVFLGEAILIDKIVGSLLILSGLTLVSLEKQKIVVGRGELLALAAGFLYGLSYLNGFYILQSLDAFSFTVYGSLLPAFFLLAIQPSTLNKLKFYARPKNSASVFITAFLDVVATVSLYLAYQIGRNASQVIPLSASSLMITVVFAAVFLKEKENMFKKIIGSAIVVLGVILVK
jgi:drug/metabolite transporter (DMT)-like permease